MDKRIEELRDIMEELRKEIDKAFLDKDYEVYMQKSKVMDKYLEEFIALEKELGLVEV